MTNQEPERTRSAAEDLRKTIDRLRVAINDANDVHDRLSDLTEKSKSNRSMINTVGILAAVNLLIVAAVIVLGVQLSGVVSVQRDSALCPLYSIFLEADTPENRQRAIDQGQDIDQRDKAFRVIHRSYDALNCSEDAER